MHKRKITHEQDKTNKLQTYLNQVFARESIIFTTTMNGETERERERERMGRREGGGRGGRKRREEDHAAGVQESRKGRQTE